MPTPAAVIRSVRPLAFLVAALVACNAALPQPTAAPSAAAEPTQAVASATPKPLPVIRARSVSVVGSTVAASGDFNGTKTTQVALVQDPAADLSLRITVRERIAADGSADTLWFKSDPNFLALPRAKFVVADVDADGKDDLVALYDAGANTSRLYVFRSTGTGFAFANAWWTGADYMWARARNIVSGRFGASDRDVLLVTYQDDGARMRIHAFESNGTAFALAGTVYDSGPGQFDLARARFAVGRFTRTGGADELAAFYQSDARAHLLFFEPGAGGLALQRDVYVSDAAYDLSKATLAAADVDGDGHDDLVSLYVDADGGARVHVFDAASGFRPANGWTGLAALAPGAMCPSTGALVLGDWDADGRADALALAPAVANAVRAHRLASAGTTFTVSSTAEALRCPVWPLTGLPLLGANATQRPLYVKIDNNPSARPHYGISKADQVYEWLVEGLTTRLAAVFQSQQPDVIGSVRSARMTDRPILPSLGAAFVYSGGGPEELMAIHYDDAVGHRYVDIAPSYGWGYRVEFRHAPYNYFTSYGALKAAIAAAPDGDQAAIVAAWSFLPTAAGDANAGGFAASVPASSITIPYRAGFEVGYRYDPASRTYARFDDGDREIDAANGQAIAARNIVVIQTDVHFTNDFGLDPAGNPKLDMQLTGSGTGVAFRDGQRLELTWTRPDIVDAFTLRNASGEIVQLSPGQTWIHIVPSDWTIPSQ
ncbi:MAG: DUF3048 domain-containing protein [Candidatus Limnocylindria bacterium]|nr:DUF3048 domain-containing protein [Candidatus Limnocylindria bacterium]